MMIISAGSTAVFSLKSAVTGGDAVDQQRKASQSVTRCCDLPLRCSNVIETHEHAGEFKEG
jgi:hypothetical protein